MFLALTVSPTGVTRAKIYECYYDWVEEYTDRDDQTFYKANDDFVLKHPAYYQPAKEEKYLPSWSELVESKESLGSFMYFYYQSTGYRYHRVFWKKAQISRYLLDANEDKYRRILILEMMKLWSFD